MRAGFAGLLRRSGIISWVFFFLFFIFLFLFLFLLLLLCVLLFVRWCLVGLFSPTTNIYAVEENVVEATSNLSESQFLLSCWGTIQSLRCRSLPLSSSSRASPCHCWMITFFQGSGSAWGSKVWGYRCTSFDSLIFETLSVASGSGLDMIAGVLVESRYREDQDARG